MKKFLAKAFGWLCVAAGVFGLIEGRFEGVLMSFFVGFGLILFTD